VLFVHNSPAGTRPRSSFFGIQWIVVRGLRVTRRVIYTCCPTTTTPPAVVNEHSFHRFPLTP